MSAAARTLVVRVPAAPVPRAAERSRLFRRPLEPEVGREAAGVALDRPNERARLDAVWGRKVGIERVEPWRSRAELPANAYSPGPFPRVACQTASTSRTSSLTR
jgi:hypothetical protein